MASLLKQVNHGIHAYCLSTGQRRTSHEPKNSEAADTFESISPSLKKTPVQTTNFTAALGQRYRQTEELLRRSYFGEEESITLYRKMTMEEFQTWQDSAKKNAGLAHTSSRQTRFYGHDQAVDLWHETPFYRGIIHCAQSEAPGRAGLELTNFTSWSTNLRVTNKFCAMTPDLDLENLPVIAVTVPRWQAIRCPATTAESEYLLRGGLEVPADCWRQVDVEELRKHPYPAEGFLDKSGRCSRFQWVPGLGYLPSQSIPLQNKHPYGTFPPPPGVHIWTIEAQKGRE